MTVIVLLIKIIAEINDRGIMSVVDPNEPVINFNRLPLAFCKGLTCKNNVIWNGKRIIPAGINITQELINQYADIAISLPIAVRVVGSTKKMYEVVKENIIEEKQIRVMVKLQELGLGTPIKTGKVVELKAGETLFTQNEKINLHLYMLTKGEVEVLIDGLRVCTIKDPGRPIGEMSFLTDAPRTATIKALKDTRFLCIEREERDLMLRHNPTVTMTLLETLVHRLTETSKRLVDVQFMHPEDIAAQMNPLKSNNTSK